MADTKRQVFVIWEVVIKRILVILIMVDWILIWNKKVHRKIGGGTYGHERR